MIFCDDIMMGGYNDAGGIGYSTAVLKGKFCNNNRVCGYENKVSIGFITIYDSGVIVFSDEMDGFVDVDIFIIWG